jgi:hypothetical protein
MKRAAQILVLTAMLCVALSARERIAAQANEAEEQVTLATFQIWLWPEFDRPDMLLIYSGILEPETPLPAPVEIRIPADVGGPTAVAYLDQDGQRLNLAYTTRVEGEEQIVSFDLPTLGFQLEYYDSLSVGDAGRRTYTFEFQADYAIGELGIEFQVPPTGRNASLEPPADSVVPEADGLVYHIVQAGSLAQGEARTWTFGYDKDDADLTVSASAQQEIASALPPVTAPAEGNAPAGLLFLVAFVALVAVGAAAFWLGRRTGTEAVPAGEAPFPARKKRLDRGVDPGAYCHKCGTQLRFDSLFCHKCGAAVRQE